MAIQTQNLGYPRIGANRELKRAIEAYWKGRCSRTELGAAGAAIRRASWRAQQAAGIDLIPSNDFSFYDQVLDTCALVGAVPRRFNWQSQTVSLDTIFTMARGAPPTGTTETLPTTTAMEMTKWFDTNYHYIVPELEADQPFRVASNAVFEAYEEAQELGILTKPVLLGPVSFLMLAKGSDTSIDTLSLLDSLIPVYVEILTRLERLGATWVQMDEPVLVLDLLPRHHAALATAYAAFTKATTQIKIMLTTYFGDLGENLDAALALPVRGLHLDVTRGSAALDAALPRVPRNMALSIGVVDGRNIWKNDFARSLAALARARVVLGDDRIMVAPSCSLLHVPVTLANESGLEPEVKRWLAFADEKLHEVQDLARLAASPDPTTDARFMENVADRRARTLSTRIHDPAVKARCSALVPGDARRTNRFPERQIVQQQVLNLPLFPTTTIGSFPQTGDIRAARGAWRTGEETRASYDRFLEAEIRKAVKLQEDVGLDVLVHGEFERNDMVEYFGEQLSGFAFTQRGWVQSYGSRCVKPPIILGDVSRPKPMTVAWSTFAQSLTTKPVKGMLTGPITILQWSFVRDDQPRTE
ncbi:MAG: 5-methyltetrahydropteroyltriglutamate--homocysteine S-methyltransferase, partial [Phycisphaeraceae bacterium]|nr:5-methyltetrahydropteroyltriglutamate--homocysteine S-methyltransferase [Phycisphaeraceae bacterium]